MTVSSVSSPTCFDSKIFDEKRGIRGNTWMRRNAWVVGGDRTYTWTNANVIYKFTSRSCILTSTNLIWSFHWTTFSLSLSLSLFLSYLMLSRATDLMKFAWEIHSNYYYSNVQYRNRELFNKHRRTFRCFLGFFFFFFVVYSVYTLVFH